MLQSQYSSDWYDAIWKPYRRYIEDFIKKNPKGLHSFLRLSKLLSYHEGLLHIKELRFVEFEAVDWGQLEKLFVDQSRYVSRFFGGQRYFVPETGSRTHWMGFVLANAIIGHFDNAKTYIELGSGIGGMLFAIHGFTLNNKNRYYGVDYSEDGVEGGDAAFSLLSSEEYSPFWKFIQSDILIINFILSALCLVKLK